MKLLGLLTLLVLTAVQTNYTLKSYYNKNIGVEQGTFGSDTLKLFVINFPDTTGSKNAKQKLVEYLDFRATKRFFLDKAGKVKDVHYSSYPVEENIPTLLSLTQKDNTIKMIVNYKKRIETDTTKPWTENYIYTIVKMTRDKMILKIKK